MANSTQPDTAAVRKFLGVLTGERDTFNFDEARICGAEMLEAHMEDGAVAGLTGIYRMYGLPTFFIVVNTAVQGRGIGRQLMERLDERARRTYAAVVLTVYRTNERAVRLYSRQGYRALGDIGGVTYMMRTYTAAGVLLFHLLQVTFPLIRILRRHKHAG